MKISKSIKEVMLKGIKIIKEYISGEDIYSVLFELDKFEIEFCIEIEKSGYYNFYLKFKIEKYVMVVYFVDIDGLCYGDVRLNFELSEVLKVKIGRVFLESG